MAKYHLAQFNYARARKPLDEMPDFKVLIDPVHAIADETPGFVWRLVAEGEKDATSLRPVGEDGIINFTVWETREALDKFVYRGSHGAAYRARRRWFVETDEVKVVLWWIPAGHTPTMEEALERLEWLRRHGPSPRAFSMNERYGPEDAEAFEAQAAEPLKTPS